MRNGEIELSKWWRTPSAQAAMARVAAKRKERSAKVKAYFASRKAKHAAMLKSLDAEIWKGVKA